MLKSTAALLLSLLILSFSANPAQTQPALPLPARDSGELLIGGDFEADTDGDKIPDGWTGKKTSLPKADKRKCNKPEASVAHSGECAFMFRGNPGGTASKLMQTISDVSALVDGATVQFSAYIDPRSGTPGATFAKAKISLSDGSKFTLKLSMPEADDYVQVTENMVLDLAGLTVTQVKVQFMSKQAKGKFLIDDVWLTIHNVSPTDTPTGTDTIPTQTLSTGTIALTATATSAEATFTPEIPTITASPTATTTEYSSETPTASFTDAQTPTLISSATPTTTLTNTPTNTKTPKPTNTKGPTNTPAPTHTASNTRTPTLTHTPTFTPTITPTVTPTSTPLTANMQLIAEDGEAWTLLGYPVAIDGNTALLGSANDAVYVFNFDGTNWIQRQKLEPVNLAPEQNFGDPVLLSGNMALIGADSYESTEGEVYIFAFDGTTWTQQQILTADDGSIANHFGAKITWSGNTLMVSAPGADEGRGAVYVFTFDGTTWTQQQKLTFNPGDQTSTTTFGYGLTMHNDTAMIGLYTYQTATESIYVYNFNGTEWVRGQKLTAAKPADTARLGFSIALADNTALVVATSPNDEDRGRVYVFTFNGSTWVQTQQFAAHNPRNYFGNQVMLRGNTAIVTASIHYNFQVSLPPGILPGSGVYIFTFDGSQWLERQAIGNDEWHGISVAISGNTLLLGVPTEPVGSNNRQGIGYIYEFPF